MIIKFGETEIDVDYANDNPEEVTEVLWTNEDGEEMDLTEFYWATGNMNEISEAIMEHKKIKDEY